jgi:dCTP deaminase
MNARWTSRSRPPGQAPQAGDQDVRRERATGIEPAFSAWEADVLPLNYARDRFDLTSWSCRRHPRRPAASGSVADVILSDRSIAEELAAGRVVIDPLGEGCLQPSSVDLHVDNLFRLFRNHSVEVIDVALDQEELTELVQVPGDGALVLHPGEFVLGATAERVALPDDLVGRLEGKSSLGRLGLLIHSTAGFVDPGFDGHLTLELSNVANLPIKVYPGMKIGQISFLRMTSPAAHPYGSREAGSRYQHQRGPTPSRYHLGADPSRLATSPSRPSRPLADGESA